MSRVSVVRWSLRRKKRKGGQLEGKIKERYRGIEMGYLHRWLSRVHAPFCSCYLDLEDPCRFLDPTSPHPSRATTSPWEHLDPSCPCRRFDRFEVVKPSDVSSSRKKREAAMEERGKRRSGQLDAEDRRQRRLTSFSVLSLFESLSSRLL